MRKRLDSVRQHIKHSDLFASLQNKFEQNDELLSLVKQQLPDTLEKHCTSIYKQGQTLVMYVSAQVWATRLLFLKRQLTEATGTQRLRIRVATVSDEIRLNKNSLKKQYPRHSQAGATVLAQAADNFEDQAISSVLKRLAKSVDEHET